MISIQKFYLKRLKKIDLEYSEIVHINNKKRLVRALEIFEITGKGPSHHFKNQKKTTWVQKCLQFI